MILLLLLAQLSVVPVTPVPGAPIAAIAAPGAVKTAAVKTAAAKPASDELICRSDTATGHRISARTCRTQAEWAQLQEASERLLDHRYTTYGQGNTCPSGMQCFR